MVNDLSVSLKFSKHSTISNLHQNKLSLPNRRMRCLLADSGNKAYLVVVPELYRTFEVVVARQREEPKKQDIIVRLRG